MTLADTKIEFSLDIAVAIIWSYRSGEITYMEKDYIHKRKK